MYVCAPNKAYSNNILCKNMVWPLHENQCTPAGTCLNEYYGPVEEHTELNFFYKLLLSPMVLISLIWSSLRYYSRCITKISIPLKPDLPPKLDHCPPHETLIFNIETMIIMLCFAIAQLGIDIAIVIYQIIRLLGKNMFKFHYVV